MTPEDSHLDSPGDRLQALIDRSRDPSAAIGCAKPDALRPEVLERLLSIARAMNRLHDRESFLAYLRDRLRELFDAQNSMVILVGRDGSLRILGREQEDAESEVSHTLVERMTIERRPFLVRDTSQDEGLRDRTSVNRLGLVSVLCAPLMVDENLIGMIQFDYRDRPGPFTEEDLTILELFAHQAATGLKNLLLVEQLEDALDSMRKAQAQLVANERLRALGEMSAAVAHDFNNMLTPIIGISDLLLRKEELPETVRRRVETLQTTAMTGASTVQRLQAFAGGSPGEESLGSVELHALVEDVVSMWRHRFEEGHSSAPYRLKLEFGGIPPVQGRPAELRDVLMNLVLNGVEAMPSGGTLLIRTLERGGSVVIEVEDTGVGIEPEVRERIFEPFFTTKPDGHGLGLSICYGVISRMGGSIDVRPGSTGGTVLSLTLPIASRGPAAAEPEVAREEAPGSARVLVVDDKPDVLAVMCELVEAAGHAAVGAGSGREALEERQRGAFDLILTDFGMPEMNGIQLTREIRSRHGDVPVVLLTGWNPGVDDCPAGGEGVSLVLRKPITGSKLSLALGEALARRV